MTKQNYKVEWDAYPDNLKRIMGDMMKTDDFTDVTLVSDDKKQIKAHRNILAACSPFFKNILQIEERNNHIIYLRGIQYSELELVLEFMYLGEATFDRERINEFVLVAKNLEIKEFEKNVEETLDSKHQFSSLNQNCVVVESNEWNENTKVIDSILEPDTLLHKDVESFYGKNEDEELNENVVNEFNTVESNSMKHQDRSRDDNEASPEGAVEIYKCSKCDFQSHNKCSRNRHALIHGSDRLRYACNFCGYRASRQEHLIRHSESKHEGIKYACNQCEYEGSKGALIHHKKAKH